MPIETDVLFSTTMVAYKENIDQVAELSPSSLRMKEEDPYLINLLLLPFIFLGNIEEAFARFFPR